MSRGPSARLSPSDHLRSAASLLVITLNLLMWSMPLILLAIVKLLVPALAVRRSVDAAMAAIYRAAVVVDDWWLGRVIGIRWSRPPLELDRRRSILVLSNHVSAADIFLIQSLIARAGPLPKFLVKRELIYMPIVGLVIWAFDFPMLRRRSRPGEDDADRHRGDLEALREASRIVREQSPAALISFAEGTRFRERKRLAAGSPYRHLLQPRVGGLLTLVEALGDELDGLIDVTLVYPEPVSFWSFLSGAHPEIAILAEKVDVAALPKTRAEARAWLDERWRAKDVAIARLSTTLGAGREGLAEPQT